MTRDTGTPYTDTLIKDLFLYFFPFHINKCEKVRKLTGNLRTLAMASSKGSDTPTKSFPGSLCAGTLSLYNLQNPSSLFSISFGISPLFLLSSSFFSDGYRRFPLRFVAHRTLSTPAAPQRLPSPGNLGFSSSLEPTHSCKSENLAENAIEERSDGAPSFLQISSSQTEQARNGGKN